MKLVRLTTSVIFGAALALCGDARAENIKVGSTVELATIQAAVDRALSNADASDTISIPAGIYDETVTITLTGANAQESLTVKRQGSGVVIVRGVADEAAFSISDAEGVTLKNLVVQSGSLASGGVDDGVAAIDIFGNTKNVVLDTLTGVAGDDVGVDVTGAAARGVAILNANFSGMSRVAFRLDGSDHTLRNCVANGAGENGFLLLETSENCRLVDCSGLGLGVGDDDEPGYYTIRGRGHEIENCDAISGQDGFFVAGSGHHFVDCDSSLNAQSAYSCLTVTDTRFERCDGELSLIGFTGGGAGVIVDGCKFVNNSAHGAFVTVDRVKVVGCRADANGGSGIYVLAGVERAHLRDNKLKSNAGEGILVDGDDCWIDSNVASGGDGIVDSGSGNSGRGNIAKSGATNDFP
jgi:Right handed beta helix region